MGRFDPNEGDLSVVLRRYTADNVLQPFHASQQVEPKLCALLSVAADHCDFAQFIASSVERVRSSRVTTELLFLMDKLVQANLHALLSLIKFDSVNGLDWTKAVKPEGAAVLVEIYKYHERVLRERGIWDEAALALRHDQVRIGILEDLIRTTPQSYRVNDARFLIGEIYWHQGRVIEAVKLWRQIAPEPTDEYFLVYSELLATLARHLVQIVR